MNSLQDKLLFVNESLAAIRKFRPGWYERYRMNEALSERQLDEFEAANRCVLPYEYREFLRLVGDGGCGFMSLLQPHDECGCPRCYGEIVDLSRPFPFFTEWPGDPDDEEPWARAELVAGSIVVGEIGCGMWERLVVTGPCAGEVWGDLRGDSGGLTPYVTLEGNRVSFLDWFMDWFEIDAWRYACPGVGRQAQRESGIKLL